MAEKQLVINTARCKACGLCMHFCVKEALSLGEQFNEMGYNFVGVDEEECVKCDICQTICPDVALRVAVMSNLNFLFNPESVALVGASADTRKYGGWTAKTLVEHGYGGDLYFVSKSKKVDKILGKELYPSVLDVPGPVDLALVAVPIPACQPTIEECGKKGVKAAIIVTTGFGEAGEEGRRIENEVVETANKYGVRLMGPNCMGHFSADMHLNTSIIDLDQGPLSLVAQSGNLGIDLNNDTKARNLGYSKWATIGNQRDLRFHEFVEHIADDEATRVLMLYIEGLMVDSPDDARLFMQKAADAIQKKPICALKIGRSQAGARAAASHTGSLAGSEAIFDAALKQCGVIRIQESQDFLNVSEAFARCVPPKGKRIAIMTDGGGHGVMATDAAEKYGLEIPVLSEATQAKLREHLSYYCPMKNPVDLAGPERDMWGFDHVTRILLEDPDIDGLAIVGLLGGYASLSEEFAELEMDISRAMVARIKASGKAVTMHSIHRHAMPDCLKLFRDSGIPIYQHVEPAMMAMGKLWQYSQAKERVARAKQAPAIVLSSDVRSVTGALIEKVRGENRTVILEHEARDILNAYGFEQPACKLATSTDEAISCWKEIGAPVAMKIVSPQIVHKSDAGGVKLNLNSEADITAAFDTIMDSANSYHASAELAGVLILPMAPAGIECIIGASCDNTFGPTIMFGLGGIFVEVLKDVSFRVAPITLPTAHEMIEEIKGYPLLKGARRQGGVDVDALAEGLQRLSQLMAEEPEIAEIDLNPVFAHEKGFSMVDARIILHDIK